MSALSRLAGLLLAAALPAGAAAEDGLGVLAVADPPGPSAELAGLAGQLRAALATRSAGVLGAATLRERMVGVPPATLAELDRAYAGALAAHAAGDFEGAVRTLRQVAADLEHHPEGGEVFGQWARAMLRLARGEQELGRRVEAQAVVERLLRAAPETRADARLYPPSFVALVDEARERLRALGTRRLTVEAQPEARVFVEGRELGFSPVTLDLPPGRYRVAGLRGGVRVPAVVVDLAAEDRLVQLDMSLVEALRPDAGPGLALAEPDRDRVYAAAARLDLDRVVAVAQVRRGGATWLQASLHDARRATVVREGRVALMRGVAEAGALDALGAWLLTGAGSALVVTATGPTLEVDPRGPDSLLDPRPAPGQARRRALNWGAVGTGAAGMAAGGAAVLLGLRASAEYDGARAMLVGGRVQAPHSVAEYNAAIRRGDDRRQAATFAAVGAGVGLAASAVMAWLAAEHGVARPGAP